MMPDPVQIIILENTPKADPVELFSSPEMTFFPQRPKSHFLSLSAVVVDLKTLHTDSAASEPFQVR